jgi:hypothetical protein
LTYIEGISSSETFVKVAILPVVRTANLPSSKYYGLLIGLTREGHLQMRMSFQEGNINRSGDVGCLQHERVSAAEEEERT